LGYPAPIRREKLRWPANNSTPTCVPRAWSLKSEVLRHLNSFIGSSSKTNTERLYVATKTYNTHILYISHCDIICPRCNARALTKTHSSSCNYNTPAVAIILFTFFNRYLGRIIQQLQSHLMRGCNHTTPAVAITPLCPDTKTSQLCIVKVKEVGFFPCIKCLPHPGDKHIKYVCILQNNTQS
jgi:hypothetical protein